jgi:hypothetical protein
MLLKDLPARLFPKLPSARLRSPLGTMAFLRITRENRSFEIALAGPVVSSRGYSYSKWSKWDDVAYWTPGSEPDKKIYDFAGARKQWDSAIETRFGTGFSCIVNEPLFVPLNDTDLKNLYLHEKIPRWALQFGGNVFDALIQHAGEHPEAVSMPEVPDLSKMSGPAVEVSTAYASMVDTVDRMSAIVDEEVPSAR